MQLFRRHALALPVLLAAFGAARAEAAPQTIASGTLTFCSSISQPPFESYTAANVPQGIDIELGDAIAKRLGLVAAWHNIPFAGLIPALQAGQCDAILSDLFVKEERMRVLNFVPYMYSQEVLLLKSGTKGITALADLSGKKAATVTGTTATQLLQAASDKLKAEGKVPIDIVAFPENTAALEQLRFGQVDAFGVAYEIAQYYIAQSPGTFQQGGPAYFKILTGIGLRKDSAALQAAMQGAFDAMRKDGAYTALLAKYHLADDALPAS